MPIVRLLVDDEEPEEVVLSSDGTVGVTAGADVVLCATTKVEAVPVELLIVNVDVKDAVSILREPVELALSVSTQEESLLQP